MTLKAILFDWDGTLVDSWGVIVESFQKAQEEMGQEVWSYEKSRRILGKSLRDQFPIIFGDDWEKARDVYYRHFNEIHLEKTTLIDGAQELVDYLYNKDVFVALVSNKTGKYLRQEVEKMGWEKYFSAVVGATDAPYDKPKPDPMYLALKDTDFIVDDSVWYVGDSVIDMETAHNIGCEAVRVKAPGMELPSQDPVFKAKYILQSLREFIELPEVKSL